jgi:hypothetical protein
MLTGIYERVRACEFQPSADHVLQVMKVEQTIVGKKKAGKRKPIIVDVCGVNLVLKFYFEILKFVCFIAV